MNLDTLCLRIGADGFCFVPARDAQSLLAGNALDDWPAFAASWNDMPLDTYMADGGRYRRRRYATLGIAAGTHQAKLEAHQPHYQSRDYNLLNGGIARYYEPIPDAVVHGATLSALFALCHTMIDRFAPQRDWHVEAHQFRIEANIAQTGLPTPEGVHRDGVDYVLVMMVKRQNIAQGTTTIHDNDRRPVASFTLTEPFDMTLLDDHRCLHGVTPVVSLDPAQPAYRDVLVLTFRDELNRASS
jgi:hypothetical protein